ncbi:putative CRP/FNR family transcriptional regulator [Sphingomonas changbaiensis NBRC 104936]|uniref:Putative CRP/FNR family transcriptional regulator n=1 Tax=Sphingomonas changbaiensis NBRC 104936 TaxID=1219043 RepID=A0A0E9MJ79_9SPHN|nr:Crp/Fnr family transcriptional regulator [Sphingomonas changbaiensis]GAO37862.1 putative CRP/FNR family transcriptional regulator [Sphingomonas changbaiensis NBRC 104936]
MAPYFDRIPNPAPCVACPLRRLPVFRANTIEEVAFIEHMRMDQIKVTAGHTICHEGDPSPPLASLFSGWAFRYKTLPDDRRQILNFLLPGDVIGFQANMLGEAAHGVEALTDVVLCRHSRDQLWPLYCTYPELAFDTTWLTAKEESLVDEVLLSVGRRTAAERVAMLMIHLYRRARAIQPSGDDVVHMPVTQQHIADALGLSLVHTNKTLRRLQKFGFFSFRQQQLQVPNLKALEQFAHFAEPPPRPRPLL